MEVSPLLVQELAGFGTVPTRDISVATVATTEADLAVDDSIELMTSAMASLQALSDHQASF